MNERQLQIQCFNWFLFAIESRGDGYMFSVPNGGSRHKLEAVNLRKEGQRAGVADTVLMLKEVVFVEFKAPATYKMGKRGGMIIDRKGGTQSPDQKEFQAKAEALGYKYYLCDNLDDFIKICEESNNG